MTLACLQNLSQFCTFDILISALIMATSTIKKQVDTYLPLLTEKQQSLVLEMIKNFLNVDKEVEKITLKQYNSELEAAMKRIESGDFISKDAANNELSKW
jgi:hypothetical protein